MEEDIEILKKKRRSKQGKDKNAATGTILNQAQFDEAQKTTVADETRKHLKLIVQTGVWKTRNAWSARNIKQLLILITILGHFCVHPRPCTVYCFALFTANSVFLSINAQSLIHGSLIRS